MGKIYNALTNANFARRVLALRKERGLTQHALSDSTGIHVQQIKRYEAGRSLPTAEALKRLAIALHVASDFLLFQTNERELEDDMRLRFEALSRMPDEDRQIVKALLDAMITKNQMAQAAVRAAKEKE